MRHKIILILLVLVTLYAKAGEKNRIPNANVVSIFLKDSNTDVNNNYIVNFFVGELWAYLSSKGIQTVYCRNVESAENAWYMMLDFSGKSTLSASGIWHYEYYNVGIYCVPADKSARENGGYWIYLEDFKVGTQKGDLTRYFQKRLTK